MDIDSVVAFVFYCDNIGLEISTNDTLHCVREMRLCEFQQELLSLKNFVKTRLK